MNRPKILKHFDNKYGVQLHAYGCRANTMKLALTTFINRGGEFILETGCQRGLDDYGAGCSTSIFADIANEYGGLLYTIDIDPNNIEVAKTACADNANVVEFICGDSLEKLSTIHGVVDLLYLDSYDYPDYEVASLLSKRHNLRMDLIYSTGIFSNLDSYYDDQEIMDLVRPCQIHQLNEFKEAERLLVPGSVILLDDCDLPGGGKSALLHDYLVQHSDKYSLLLMEYQSVWIRL